MIEHTEEMIAKFIDIIYMYTTRALHSQNGEIVVTHIKGRLRFSSVACLLKIGTSLKGQNLLPEAANSVL